MPLREYECPRCNYMVRQFDHFGKKPLPVCLSCGNWMKLLISKSSFILRGIGWAAEGYSKDIDDAEEHWARDGKPVGNHVRGCEQYQQNKKTELVNALKKNL